MVLLLWSMLNPALAAKPDAPPPKVLEEVLVEAGWTMTPERTSAYQAGDIYDLSSNTKVAARSDCFDRAPQEDVYTSLHVVQAMRATANVRLGVVKLRGGGVQYKQRTFAEPYLQELPLLSQTLTPGCAASLSRLDVSSMVVLIAVLSAEVKEENCTTIEGGVEVLGTGGELGVSQQCKEESAGHVAVAYKTRAVADLVAPARAASPAVVPAANPAPRAVANPIGDAEMSLGGDAHDFAAMAAKAREAEADAAEADRMKREAVARQEKAEAILAAERERKLDAAAAEVGAAATRDFAAIASLVSDPSEQSVPVLRAYLDRYGAAEVRVDDEVMSVSLPEVALVRAALAPVPAPASSSPHQKVPMDVIKALLTNNRGVKSCFLPLIRAGTPPDRVDVRFDLHSTGKVSECGIVQSEYAGSSLESCLEQAIRAVDFPSSRGSQRITYPFILK
jgi:hypothetical protein